MKSIIKEVVIIILLCIAICLIFGIIFYNYIPSNIVVPGNVEAYSTSETIKEEINEDIVEYPKESVVFEITDSDLTLYKKSKSYDEGKANPFASSNTTSTGTDTSSGDSGSDNSSGNNNSDVKNDNSANSVNTDNSTETVFEDTKLK